MKRILLSVAMLAFVQFGASAHGKSCHCSCKSTHHHATAYHKKTSRHHVGLLSQNKWFGNNTVKSYTGYMPDYLDIYGYKPEPVIQIPYSAPIMDDNYKVDKPYVAPESPNRDHYKGLAPQSPNQDDYRNKLDKYQNDHNDQ